MWRRGEIYLIQERLEAWSSLQLRVSWAIVDMRVSKMCVFVCVNHRAITLIQLGLYKRTCERGDTDKRCLSIRDSLPSIQRRGYANVAVALGWIDLNGHLVQWRGVDVVK